MTLLIITSIAGIAITAGCIGYLIGISNQHPQGGTMKHAPLSTTWRNSQVPNGPVQWAAMARTLQEGARRYHNWRAHAGRVISILVRRQSS